MIKYTMISMILLFLLGCQTDFPVNMIPKNFNILIYNSGHIVDSGVVETTDEMISFFENEKSGWKRMIIPITIAPSYLLSSNNLNMNVGLTRIYIKYYKAKDKLVYYYKEVNTKPLISIIKENKITTFKNNDCCIVK